MQNKAPDDLIDQYPPIDGFLLSAGLYNATPYIPAIRANLTFRSVALAQYECLRKAGAYKSKMWPVPPDSKQTIPAFDSFEYELQVPVGSAIWSYIFTSGVQSSGVSSGFGFVGFQITDACNGVPLFSEPVTKKNTDWKFTQIPLGRLLVVGAPGLLKVEITNTLPTAQSAQLVLCGGTPIWNGERK